MKTKKDSVYDYFYFAVLLNKKMIKKISLVFLFLILFVLIAPTFIHWNQYKGTILKQINENYGLNINIEGDISCSLIPSFKLEIEKISISNNSSNYSKKNILEVGALRLNIDKIALLSGNIVINEIELIKPKIFLEENGNREKNYNQFVSKKENIAIKSEPTEANNRSRFNVKISRIFITDGLLEYVEHSNNILISHIDISGSARSLSGPFIFDTNLKYKDFYFDGQVNAGAIKNNFFDTLNISLNIKKNKNSMGNIKIQGEQKTQNTFQGTITSSSFKFPLHFHLGSKKIDLQKGIVLSSHFMLTHDSYRIYDLKATYEDITLLSDCTYKNRQIDAFLKLVYKNTNIELTTCSKNKEDDILYNGDIKCEVKKTSSLLQWLGYGAPLDSLKENFAFEGSLTVKPFVISIDNLKFNLGNLYGSGELAINKSNNSSASHVVSKIHLSNLDCTKFFTSQKSQKNNKNSLNKNKNASVGNEKEWLKEKINLSIFNNFNLDLILKVDRFSYFPYTFSNLKTSLAIKNGVLKISSLDAEAYGGSIDASANLYKQQLQANLRVNEMSIQMIPAVQQTQLKKAKMNANLAIKTKGKTILEYIHHLNGSGHFKLLNGKVEAFDLKQTVSEIKNARNIAALGKIKNSIQKKGFINFSNLGGSFQLQNGVATLHEFKLLMDEGNVDVSGNINIPSWVLDLAGFVSLKEIPQLPPLHFLVKGDINNPSYNLDYTQITKILAQGLLHKMVENIKEKVLKNKSSSKGNTKKKNFVEKLENILPNLSKIFG